MTSNQIADLNNTAEVISLSYPEDRREEVKKTYVQSMIALNNNCDRRLFKMSKSIADLLVSSHVMLPSGNVNLINLYCGILKQILSSIITNLMQIKSPAIRKEFVNCLKDCLGYALTALNKASVPSEKGELS